jgi:hypothetical protein
VDPTASNADVLEESPDLLEVSTIFLDELDVEASTRIPRDPALRVEVPSRESRLLSERSERRLSQLAGRFNDPDVPFPLAIDPASAAELPEKILKHD